MSETYQNTTNHTNPTNKKSVDELAKEVIQGKWGNGIDRKKRLASFGYDYYEVQEAVEKLI